MTAKRPQPADLPDWPRLLSRDQAAAYCSVSPGTFDDHFAVHLTAIRAGARVLYDRRKIDKYIDTLQGDAEGYTTVEHALEAM